MMSSRIKLRIITPRKVVYQDEATAVTAPAADGELTVLPKHARLLTQLREGVVKVKIGGDEVFFSIGGGYLETDGQEVNILVSRAYHQDEIDEAVVKQAQLEAEKLVRESKTQEERHEAMSLLRRSLIDLKIIRRRRQIKPSTP